MNRFNYGSRLRFALLLCAALMIASTAQALTVVPRSFDELVSLADTIVIATAAEARSSRSPDGRAILTHYTLQDLELIKGAVPSAPFELSLPGGVLDDEAQLYPGVPRLLRGERYVLFLYDRELAAFLPLVGVHQGLYRVLRDAAGEARVLPERSVPPVTVTGAALAPMDATRLDDFLGAIRARLNDGDPAVESGGS
jgi:hypothetical protein